MHKLIKSCLVVMLAMTAWPACAETAQQNKPLEVGVVPYLSARVLISGYEPMRQYLEQVLGRPVKIYTSTGFKPFFLNAARGDYDLVITAAHFARILQQDYQFQPLARYAAGGHALMMTAHDSKLKSERDLHGQTIAVPDRLSLTSIVCMTYLHDKGMRAGIDFKIQEVPSFSSAILSVQKGEAAAAFSAQGALDQMPRELRESVKPLVDNGAFVSLVFLAHPRLDKSVTSLLNNALVKFANDSIAGRQFFGKTGFGSIVPITPKEMTSLDRYVAETKRLIDDAH